MALLEVRDIVAGYGGVDILRGVSLKVEEGEIVALLGPNGAGKSTLMKVVFGLLKPRHGQVLLRGREVTGLPPEALVPLGMGYVPQTDNVFPSLTVQENLEVGAFIRKDGVRQRMEALFDLFPDLARQRFRRAAHLSGGQRQMLALARALMLDPVLLLLDEPSAGLAPIMLEALLQQLRAINERGVSILMVEQNAKEALKVCHRAYILSLGQVRLEGKGTSLLEDAEVRRLYLGG